MTTDSRTELYEYLAATATLPVGRDASRLLGEAEAVASDLREVDDPDVAADRARTVCDLLAKIDETGHPEAEEYVSRARELAAELSEP